MTFHLPYRPPYHWRAMLAFLDARAVPAIEQVSATGWHRSLRVGTGNGSVGLVVSVHDEPQRNALRVDLSVPLPRDALTCLRTRLAAMFDVACDTRAVEAVLGELATADPGLRLPGSVDSFELVVRAILGQQVTVAAARTLAGRLVARFGTPLPANALQAPAPRASAGDPAESQLPTGLDHLFPTPATLAAADPAAIGELGIIRSRAAAIIAAAALLNDGRLQLDPGAAVEPALAALTAVRGIGPWTAHYIAMRTLGWRDAFPPGDVVVMKALQARNAAEAAAHAEAWRPWRAYALLHLWRRSAAAGAARRSA